MSIVSGKHIVLGVCGGIAAYKVAELARRLTLDGALVDVIMTAAARRFVGEATFQALTGRPVLGDMWELPEDGVVGHVALGRHADIVVIAPATANTLARIAAGLSDDMLTTTVLATTAPILCVPAMNTHMYENPATQANIATLRSRGLTVLEPATGQLAEPMVGKGRMPEVPEIEGQLRALLGRMGYALASEARDLGAQVTLISGPTNLPSPAAIDVVRIETALELRDAVHAAIDGADLLIMNAAVADFRPAERSERKIKKGEDEELEVRLVRNPDILAGLAARRDLIKIGFAAETQSLLEYAQSKLERKGLDLIIANEAVASIGQAEIQVALLDGERVQQLPRQPKEQAAAAILAELLRRWPGRLAPRDEGDRSPRKHEDQGVS